MTNPTRPARELTITSASNPRLKGLLGLRRRRTREETGQTLVEGYEEIGLALSAGVRPSTVYVCEDLFSPAGRAGSQPKPARESVVSVEALVPVGAAAPDAHDPPSDKIAVVSSPSRHSFDRVLGLADALDNCASEPLFARLACEARARTRYCDGAAASIPQCADSTSRE